MTDSVHFWVPRVVNTEKCALWRFGPLRIWIKRTKDEWSFGLERGDAAMRDCCYVPGDVVPEKVNWTSYSLAGDYREFEVEPLVPERPVVIRPHHPVILPPGQAARFYARVPVVVRFHAISSDKGTPKIPMFTAPTVILSDTWFGDTMEGLLCHALRTDASRSPEALDAGPHHLVCPVTLRNRSNEDLPFERLCLRLEHVDIYADTGHLWSSEICVTHQGKGQPSQIDYQTGTPSYAKNLPQLHKAEQKPQNLARRSFSWLAHLPSYLS